MFTKAFILLVLIFSWLTIGEARATNYQDHTAIYQAVTDYLKSHVKASSNYEFSITPLDNRLQLPACGGNLQAFNPHNQPIRAGRLSIGVRCSDVGMWSIFTSVQLKVYARVLVLTQPVLPGQMLTRQLLSTEKRDTAGLGFGYFTRLDAVENKQATRYLAAGTVLHDGLVTEPTVIKRGEKIVISAVTPSYDIRMLGIALMDGAKGQSIKVKNLSSGRTVSAKVVKQGLVSVVY